MWFVLLSHWNGISMFLHDNPVSATELNLFTDASGKEGHGGYYRGQWFSASWPTELAGYVQDDMSIAFKELYPIVVASMLWGHTWSRQRVRFNCDNISVVYILNKGRS